MIYNVTSLPSIFHVEPGCINQVAQLLDRHGIAANRVLVLTGKSHSLEIAKKVIEGFSSADLWVIESYSEAEVTRLRDAISTKGKTLLIAVGGGGVIDVAKRASKIHGVPCLVVPTVVSNDGLMSPISVLKTSEHRSDSLPSAMPIGVVADLDILMAAPKQYLRAAGGDLLSNLSATSDWRYTVERGDGLKMNDAAFHLARNSAESLVHSSDCDLRSPRFVRSLVVAQIYSGIAMTLAGTSRPCSGPEHLISHAIDELGLTKDVLHGVQVGSLCFFMLYLLGELNHDVMRFGQSMQIPALWTDLSPEIEEAIPDIFKRAREVRPDRRTILDDLSDKELGDQLAMFGGWRQVKLKRV